MLLTFFFGCLFLFTAGGDLSCLLLSALPRPNFGKLRLTFFPAVIQIPIADIFLITLRYLRRALDV